MAVCYPIRVPKPNVCVLTCLHDDHWFVERSLSVCKSAGPLLAVISRTAWNGTDGDWQRTATEAEKAGAEIILGDWTEESDQRRFAIQEARERGFTHALIPDGDEVIEPKLLDTLIKLAKAEVAERVYVHMDTYWKSARYVIRPREQLTPVILLDLRAVEHVHIRDFAGGRPLFLGPEHGVIHHLSYAGPDERIRRKLDTWSHRNEVAEDWYRRVWQGWDREPLSSNLHPTHPPAYGFAEPIEIPEVLQGVWDERPVATDPVKPVNWPTVSIVIPLYGGEEDIRACLQSLKECNDLIHETIVIDDASPDNARQVAESFENITVLRNETNLGFGQTSNRGYEASSGEIVLFLNSDTRVPRAGLIRLIETLMSSGTIGAAGPYTNNAGYEQPIFTTYTDVENLNLFAQDFAARDSDDRDVPMLVGFCLAVRRSVLKEVGIFDPRYGKGLFEDNDLCYRIQRAGYRCRLATRSYVHHQGSKSLFRMPDDPKVLLARNMDLYHAKWREDIESGFASHLPGQKVEPIVFRPELQPEKRRAEIRRLAKEADISLCMIVRDEERVIRNCLESAMLFFAETIVVDTGSTDRTREIAQELGAHIYEFPWTDSFSDARNESLKHAKGKWIFWLDADDVLPWGSGEAILHAALQAPPQVAGFVVPVQFVEEGPGAGTRVDHVKLFRNLPKARFEGHIHEQILGSLRPYGEIARIEGAVVMHAGYDTSEQGQKKKRVRDEKLLKMDLAERPEHPFVLFNLGMTEHFVGDHNEAVRWFRNCLDHSTSGESHVRKAYALMGVSLRELGQEDEALFCFLKGLAEVGEDAELRFQAGLLLTRLGRYEEALHHYQRVPQAAGSYFASMDIGILGYKLDHNVAGVHLSLGDYPAARKLWMQALAAAPSFLPSAYELFTAALENGDYKTARHCIARASSVSGTADICADMETRFAAATDGAQVHSASNGQTHFVADNPTLAKLSQAKALLDKGEEPEAVQMLVELSGQGSAEASFYLGVHGIRRGEYKSALAWMERALELNPNHEQTAKQVSQLKAMIASVA